jgi:hypothetical protein
MTKTLINTMWRGLQAKKVEIKTQAESRRGTGTSAGTAKPPNFDRTTSRAILAPVRDCSKAQLLDKPGESHVPAGPGHQHTTWSPKRYNI